VTGIRKPNIPKGIEKLNLEMNNGFIKVDDNLMTSKSSIYAVGDINGIHGMAHIALQQGILLADYIWEGKPISTQYSSLPRCIFTINELAGAGCQEHEL
jgi:Pyruvate/2-oxoglutarate dehydrogenase complex, dihydrolipoamide dehydrogenase (E3) component, and related enzymes